MIIQLNAVRSFLVAKGWTHLKDYKNYSHYEAPESLGIDNYILTIPLENKKTTTPFIKKNLENTFDILSELYEDELSTKEALLEQLLLLGRKSILSFRFIDNDTSIGTISFNRLEEFFDKLKKLLIQTIAFVTTEQQIFAQNNRATEFYLNESNVLQSERGSYIAKIEVPNSIEALSEMLDPSFPERVNNRIISIIDFLTNELIKTPAEDISSSFVKEHKDYINADVLEAVFKLYDKARIYNAEISLIHSPDIVRTIQVRNIPKKLKYYKEYHKVIKKILLDEVKLDAIGTVYKLERGNSNKVSIKATIANEQKEIICILDAANHQLAIQAYEEIIPVRITGKARIRKTGYTIDSVDLFEIIPEK